MVLLKHTVEVKTDGPQIRHNDKLAASVLKANKSAHALLNSLKHGVWNRVSMLHVKDDASTIRKSALHKYGLFGRVTTRKPLLSKKTKQKHVGTDLKKSKDFWNIGLICLKDKLEMLDHNEQNHIRRRIIYHISTMPHGSRGLMIWASFAWDLGTLQSLHYELWTLWILQTQQQIYNRMAKKESRCFSFNAWTKESCASTNGHKPQWT